MLNLKKSQLPKKKIPFDFKYEKTLLKVGKENCSSPVTMRIFFLIIENPHPSRALEAFTFSHTEAAALAEHACKQSSNRVHLLFVVALTQRSCAPKVSQNKTIMKRI